MRNSSEIFSSIQAVASTSSKNEKIAMVTTFATDEDFKRVLEYTYNPFKTYGVIPSEPKETAGLDDFNAETWDMLDRLIARNLTGTAARNEILEKFNTLNLASAQLLWRIIRKDLKADFSESTCNKAVKGLIPEFPYMRCALPKDTDLTKWPWSRGILVQEKADGMFANVDHEEGGVVRITSRQGTAFPIEKFPGVEADVRARLVAGHQHHGEFIVMRDGEVCERQDGNGVLNSVANGGDFAPNEKPVYLVWDQIPLGSVVKKGQCKTPYSMRFGGLKEQLILNGGSSIELIQTYTACSLKEAMGYYAKYLARGKEGVVIKHPDAIWKDTTSKEQIKLKLEVDVDLKIVAIVPGKDGGKNEGRPGSLTCETSDGLLRVDVTVKNDDVRARIEASPEDWIDSILAVRANAILAPSDSNELHSLFLPRMVEADYRNDKVEADSLQRVKDQFESAINPK